MKRLVADYEAEQVPDFPDTGDHRDLESATRAHGVSAANDAGSDDDDDDDEDGENDTASADGLEEEFRELEEEVATLVADVHDLALYTKVTILLYMSFDPANQISFQVELHWLYQDCQGMHIVCLNMWFVLTITFLETRCSLYQRSALLRDRTLNRISFRKIPSDH